jgi:antirestriction protein ArdC
MTNYKKGNKTKKVNLREQYAQEIADLILNEDREADLSYMHSQKLRTLPIKLTDGKPYKSYNTLHLIALQEQNDNMKIPAFVTFKEYGAMFKDWLKQGWINEEELKEQGIDPEKPLKGCPTDASVLFTQPFWKEGDKYFKREETVNGKKRTRTIPTAQEISELELKEYKMFKSHAIYSVNALPIFPDEAKAQYPIFKLAENLGQKMSPEEMDLQLKQNAYDLLESFGVPYEFSDSVETAHYTRGDTIHLGAEDRFKSHRKLLSVAAHEIGHATGAPHRLNRKSLENYSIQRGFEEAVAEIHAMLVCRSFGVDSLPEHASYVKGWLNSDTGNIKKLPSAAFEAIKGFELTMCKYEAYMKNKAENVVDFVQSKKEEVEEVKPQKRRRMKP